MKILLREWGESQYIWKTAKYNGTQFVVEDQCITYCNIVSVLNDNRANHVVCPICKTFMKNTPSVLQAHNSRKDDKDACLTCQYLHIQSASNTTTKLIRQANGQVVRKRIDTLKLGCRYRQYWGSIDLDDESVKQNCILRRCSEATMQPFTDVFLEYPGLFDHIAMVDKIIEIGYKSKHIREDSMTYQLKGRNNIRAIVNRLGIVDYFRLSYGDDDYNIYYSKKYDKLFVYECGKYTPLESGPYLPKATFEYIKRKLAAIYN